MHWVLASQERNMGIREVCEAGPNNCVELGKTLAGI